MDSNPWPLGDSLWLRNPSGNHGKPKNHSKTIKHPPFFKKPSADWGFMTNAGKHHSSNLSEECARIHFLLSLAIKVFFLPHLVSQYLQVVYLGQSAASRILSKIIGWLFLISPYTHFDHLSW